MRRSSLVLVIVLLAVMLAGVPAHADAVAEQTVVTQTTAVVAIADGAEVGEARLRRTEDAAIASIVVDGAALNSGDAYTVWAMVTNPGDATPDIGYAGGGMVFNGTLRAVAYVRRGDLTGFPDELGMASGAGLVDPRTAAITFVLRNHGPRDPGLLDDQLTTFLGGCDYSLVPPLADTAPKYGEPSDFACVDLFLATFAPPTA
jgi:hypothetical protein